MVPTHYEKEEEEEEVGARGRVFRSIGTKPSDVDVRPSESLVVVGLERSLFIGTPHQPSAIRHSSTIFRPESIHPGTFIRVFLSSFIYYSIFIRDGLQPLRFFFFWGGGGSVPCGGQLPAADWLHLFCSLQYAN